MKAAIIVLAHKNMGLEVEKLEGILKYEGGINLNRKEIAIKGGYVKDDWEPPSDGAPEEQATVDAIQMVDEILSKRGVAGLAEFGECTHGDPLRCLVN